MSKLIGEAIVHAQDHTNSNTHVSNGFIQIDDVKREPFPKTKRNECSTDETLNRTAADDQYNTSVVQYPHKNLPQPAVPNGLLRSRSCPDATPNQSLENFSIDDVPTAIGKFFRERRSSLRAEIIKRLNNRLKDEDDDADGDYIKTSRQVVVTEFKLSGIKVIVEQKEDQSRRRRHNHLHDVIGPYLKGRATFYSRSNCRDCRAVRSFFIERGIRYAEINLDVFPMREREMIERTGSGSTVPQIFFNEKLIGGLVALNSLRNSGLLESEMREMMSGECPDDAPAVPVYGVDDEEEDRTDEMAGVVRVLRQRLPIQDRLIKMRIVKNSFTGTDLADVLLRHLGCARTEAVEMCKELARKHFIHHIFGGNDFLDGNQTYRFLEHEPFIQNCFNFHGSTDEKEPKAAAAIGQQLGKIMSAILESYASEDGRHVDYVSIKNSEEFRRYLNLVQGLHRVDLSAFSSNEKLAFFLNIYNAMVIHGMIRTGYPDGILERKPLVVDFQYLIGGHSYSLGAIKNGILRSNRRPLYSLVKPFNSEDKRLELALPSVNPLIHFGLCDGTKSCPTVRFFTYQNVEAELRSATREFFQRGGMEVDLARRTVYLSRIFKWYNVDIGSSDREILKWMMSYLDARRAGLLSHLLSDGGVVKVVYQKYDWSLNS